MTGRSVQHAKLLALAAKVPNWAPGGTLLPAVRGKLLAMSEDTAKQGVRQLGQSGLTLTAEELISISRRFG